ncbi:hypothetical protein FEDK69T_11220 [Flavobacterium enshiense DK69]|uniref:DUF4199 domain-containing protein n=1 Tax=Flavobacterium enshiense DK69 TaxID=1107311 RepID=V6SBW2_9FLAO|nr:hypothetical protein [Flavobacterium enshiense]ESU23717.1 hypothetical protein FEDK69T_11220 [Flavobacterium enshiense DK69]KGO96152.1 hypothetical protein Q767_07810 [Flavobacterium enshiense DK69]
MFNRKEFKNGFIIFLGIGLYFLVMEMLGLAGHLYLRFFNIFIVLYGASRTIRANYAEGKYEYMNNFMSSVLTCAIGVALSVFGLMVYIHARGGEAYLANLSDGFIFAGGKARINEYCIGLLFEGIASSLVGSLLLMQYWHGKIPHAHHNAHDQW